MDINQIKILATQGESQQLEYKKSTANLKDILQTICAFLNGDGGIVLIGVEDNGNLVGQEVSDKTRREIGVEIAKIAPYSNSSIEIFYVQFSERKQIIVFHVTTDSTKRPYTYNGRAYIRVQSDTLLMPPDYYQHLTLNNAQFKDQWEDEPLADVTLDALDVEEIVSTIKEGVLNGRIPEGFETKDPVKALKHLGLLQGDQITRAALILFGKSPEVVFPQCILRLARFRGTNKSEFIDNKQIQGNVFKLIQSALSFANLHLPIASTFSKTSIKREDKPLFPISILREAITNALCHRDYSYTGGSVSFAIYDDRLEIWSYGLLPPGLSIDDLGELNQSIPRNRRIANVLYYHKLFESWGRGIRLIIDGCIEAGHPSPVYSVNSGGLLLTMPSALATATEVAGKPIEYQEQELTARQREIIALLDKTSGLSTAELHNQLSSPPTERWLRDELNRLKADGYVASIGSTTSRKWYIKK
jgi:ATP-dependent DNA helicase RecG|tara:strand:+ start:509 stop:1930 length:1422 start_codon:yes stop_codon:yes gene_type:complete